MPVKPWEWTAPEQRQPEESSYPLDARGANWANKVLPVLDLREANLCRTDLRGTDLSACQLDDCKLTLARYDSKTKFPINFDIKKSGAVGPLAILNGAFLNGADLRGMDLRNVKFIGAYLSGSDLSGSVLDGASFAGADLRYAKLRGCRCIGTRFGGAQMNQVDIRGANLESAAVTEAESFQGADFSLTTGFTVQELAVLLARPHTELDCWNPLTRQTTRNSLQQLEKTMGK